MPHLHLFSTSTLYSALRSIYRALKNPGSAGAPVLSIVRPFNGGPATVGNGCMATLNCENRGQVAAIHAKAIELGGQDEGPPGPRAGEESGVYAAYFRDLDGNKICAVHFTPPQQ